MCTNEHDARIIEKNGGNGGKEKGKKMEEILKLRAKAAKIIGPAFVAFGSQIQLIFF